MVNMSLVIDIVTPDAAHKRAERAAELPAMPARGDFVEVSPMLVLEVRAIRWSAMYGTVMVVLGRAPGTPSSVVDHEGELEMDGRWLDELGEAGWTLNDL